MHMLTLIPLLTAVLGRTVAAQATTVPPGPISTASSPAPSVQLEAPQWTRVESRDKQPGEEWGGWGEVDWNTPFRFEFKEGYTTEKFTLYTYAETDEWHTDGSGGWLANRGPEPIPEHTLRVSVGFHTLYAQI